MPYIYPVRRVRYVVPLATGRNRRRGARYYQAIAMRRRAMRYQRANRIYRLVRAYNTRLRRY